MRQRIFQHLRGQSVAYLALMIAVAGSGGYAIAATRSSTKTITACASKKTGELFLHTRGRCSRSEKKVSWSQKGPAGARGATGSTGTAGTAGTPAVSAWAVVAASGGSVGGQGLSVQNTAPGTYAVTVTAPACAQTTNSLVVSIVNANPPNGQAAGTFPVSWVGDSGTAQFTVFTGISSGGTFTASNQAFNAHDTCTQPAS